MLEFVSPTTALHDSWLESLTEWDLESQQGGSTYFAGIFGWDLRTPSGFESWVGLLNDMEEGIVPSGFVQQSTRWLVVDGEFAGSLGLRHVLGNEELGQFGGHVGYSVRPTMRGRGYAKAALQEGMRMASGLGIESLLLTCLDTNQASAAVIESQGGELESLVTNPKGEEVRRYWAPVNA